MLTTEAGGASSATLELTVMVPDCPRGSVKRAGHDQVSSTWPVPQPAGVRVRVGATGNPVAAPLTGSAGLVGSTRSMPGRQAVGDDRLLEHIGRGGVDADARCSS